MHGIRRSRYGYTVRVALTLTLKYLSMYVNLFDNSIIFIIQYEIHIVIARDARYIIQFQMSS